MSRPNHFAVAGVARRYAAGRPYVHDVVAREIARHSGVVAHAVDIGAGTGLSTHALLRCATQIVGVDPSIEMLDAAFRHGNVRYICGTAERLPLASGSVDLATISAAYHWCHHCELFRELERIVRPRGWIAIYDVELAGVVESPSLIGWLRDEYWAALPRCTHFGAFDSSTHVRAPFALVAETMLRVELPMTCDESVSFVLSQASSINAVSSAFTTFEALERRLRDAFATAFPRRLAATVVFDAPFALLRRR
jgi:SAM-dependent methyltransferase